MNSSTYFRPVWSAVVRHHVIETHSLLSYWLALRMRIFDLYMERERKGLRINMTRLKSDLKSGQSFYSFRFVLPRASGKNSSVCGLEI